MAIVAKRSGPANGPDGAPTGDRRGHHRRAATRLGNLRKEVREFYWGHRINPDILELRNLVTTASLVVDCAIRRKESRGIHYTLDYPGPDDRYRSNTILRRF